MLALLLLLVLNTLAYSHEVGDDFAQQVRGQAESLKEALRNLSNNPRANDVLRRLKTHTDMCFNTLDDVIDTIETGTQLVENVAEETEEILEILKGFVTGTSASLENAVKLTRAVDILVPSLVLETSETCAVTNVDEYEYIHSVSLIVSELSWTDGLLDEQYQKTGEVLAKVANFLSDYRNPHYDGTGHQNIAIVKVVGPVIVNLAKLYRLLWEDTADEMKVDEEFGQKIADNMENIPGIKSTFLDFHSVASRTFGKLPPGTREEKIYRVIFLVLSITTIIIAIVHTSIKVKRKWGRREYQVI